MKMIEYVYSGMVLLSLVLAYFAFKQYNKTQSLISTGIKTRAEVINLIEVRGDKGYTYKPVFQYTSRTGAKITFISDVASRPAPYQIGEYVNIIYSKGNDEQKVVSFWGLYRWTILLLCIAAPLLIIGAGYFLYTKSL